MSNQRQQGHAQARDSEAGYMLLAVVVMAALVLIALSVAAPMVARDIRRDKEVASQYSAQEYTRAIRLYYRKFKNYPPSIEALEKSNNIRFLRHQQIDPLTGKTDWRLIKLGQQQTTIKIPFGEELGGIASAGLGSAAGMASGASNPTLGTSTTTTIGQTSALAAGFGGASLTSTTPGSLGTNSQSTKSAFGDGSGGVIVGVGSARTGQSILTPNGQSSYDTQEYWYDPRIEQLYAKSNIMGGGGLGSGAGGSGPTSTDASKFGQSIDGKSNASPGTNTGSGPSTTITPR